MTAATELCARTETIQLRPGVYSAVTEDGQLVLVSWSVREHLGASTAGKHAALTRLAAGPCPPELLRSEALARGNGGDEVEKLVDRLRRGGWLLVVVAYRGQDRFSVRPLRTAARATTAPPDDRGGLSRFAVLRPDGSDLVLECPRAGAEIRLHDRAALAALGAMTGLSAAATEGPAEPLPDGLAADLRAELGRFGFLVPDAEAEAAELRLAQWNPTDLWFHARSRAGSRGHPGEEFGGTWWARDRFDPLPARPPAFGGPVVPLHRPDLAVLRTTDAPLTAVLEDRRSVRGHDDARPLTVEQLGEFLFRCARARRVSEYEGVQLVDRPHPSGGGFGELELYPAVWNVAGLERGLYHYDSHDHRLERVDGSERAVRRITANAVQSAAMPQRPQLVIVVAARFGRVMWKYQGMAYALVLKHVGVLYQTMYLTATAMGLAPCGLGAGDAELFSAAAGLDGLEESSVGEFMLGSRPPAGPDPRGAAG
jgi:SagB-type dehydrogenase family enzyme